LNEIYPHIDALLVKYLLREATAGEQEAVERWIAAAAENKTYFLQFQAIWETSKAAEQTASVDENAAWQLFQKRIRTQRSKVHSIKQFSWLRVAALVLIIIGAALIGYLQLRQTPVQQITAHAINTSRSDTLSDGSVITLNKNSALTYPEKFSANTRTVALQGEAFFNVTPDKSKPFVIEAGDVRIRVVGTSFNVRTENGSTEVIVATGVVQVQKGQSIVELRPEEKVVVRRQDSVLRKVAETGKLYNYYRSREFVCDNTPLWKLVAVLNEAYNANIIIEKEQLRNLPLTTTFPNESLDRILQIIELTFNIQVERRDTAIILK
jgi:ferric-dicitrate binding protein FerR (iron transport regulator)